MKKIVLLSASILVTLYGQSQSSAIDCLKSQLQATVTTNSKTVNSNMGLSKEWSLINIDRSRKYALEDQLYNAEKTTSIENIKAVKGWGTTENLMFVVGATQTEQLEKIRTIIPDHFLLVPGVGFQGGSLREVSEFGLNSDAGLLVNVSRSIIYASNGEDFATEAAVIAEQYDTEMKMIFQAVM